METKYGKKTGQIIRGKKSTGKKGTGKKVR